MVKILSIKIFLLGRLNVSVGMYIANNLDFKIRTDICLDDEQRIGNACSCLFFLSITPPSTISSHT